VESEVRQLTAAQAAAAASVFRSATWRPDWACSEVLPKLVEMVTVDERESVSNRVELAGVMLEMAEPLGAKAEEAFLTSGLVDMLVNDSSTNLRLVAISKLPSIVDVLGLEASGAVLSAIQTLLDDKNWRTRHAAMMMLPALARQMGRASFDAIFMVATADPTVTKEFGEPQAPPAASHFTALVADNVALVRTDWVRVCEQIGGVLGVEWLVEQIVPVVLRQADEKNYQKKMAVLDALGAFKSLLKGREALEKQLLSHGITMATDRVPNLRLHAATIIGQLRGFVSADALASHVTSCLETLSSDAEEDVAKCASQALASLTEYPLGQYSVAVAER